MRGTCSNIHARKRFDYFPKVKVAEKGPQCAGPDSTIIQNALKDISMQIICRLCSSRPAFNAKHM